MLVLGATFLLKVCVQRGSRALRRCCGCGCGCGGVGVARGDHGDHFTGAGLHLNSVRCALIDALHNEIEAIQAGAIRTGARVEVC